jgi:hypothetical protein
MVRVTTSVISIMKTTAIHLAGRSMDLDVLKNVQLKIVTSFVLPQTKANVVEKK